MHRQDGPAWADVSQCSAVLALRLWLRLITIMNAMMTQGLFSHLEAGPRAVCAVPLAGNTPHLLLLDSRRRIHAPEKLRTFV